jgi:hypothetical protein
MDFCLNSVDLCVPKVIKMKGLLGKKVGVVPITLLMVLFVGVAIGAVLVSKQVPMTMKVVTVNDFTILNFDKTPLASIDLGSFYRGGSKTFPATDNYWLKNTGDENMYLSWSISGLPTGTTIGLELKINTNWIITTPNTIYSDAFTPTNDVAWKFTITVGGSTPFGDAYTPVITWNCNDHF